MADEFAIGKALEIPDNVLKNIEQIDKKINDISKDSEIMAQKFNSAMIRMGNGSDVLLKKLQAIQGIIGNLGNVNVGGLSNMSNGMTKTATEAEKAANSITKVAKSLNDFGASKMNIAQLTDSIKELKKQLTEEGGVSNRGNAQQQLVNRLRAYEEELKSQKRSEDDLLSAREKAYQKELNLIDKEIAAIKKIDAEREKLAQKEKERAAKSDMQYVQGIQAEQKYNEAKQKALEKEIQLLEKQENLRSENSQKKEAELADWVVKKKKEQSEAEIRAAKETSKFLAEEQARLERIAKEEDDRRKAKRATYEDALKYAEQLDKKEEAANKKRLAEEKARAKEQERLEKERVKAAEKIAKELERQAKAQAKFDSEMRKSNYQSYVTSTSGALRTADKADTYAKREQAIRNLEEAIKKLRTTDANYQRDLQRLSDAHKRLSAEQRKVESNFRNIQMSQHNLMNTSDQLMRKLALIFSVSQIQGYLMNLVRVRGEFELQNTALASILNNKDKADRLFAQITELAVKSPFTVKELTTYTKSLSAYQVEYEKLYDTTKMLADVSAGLGVDMQRLILAFGQVKAANFLRGTETRQFTEAGINMIGELAKYYSELEGRVVSVTEVMDRQFKRMISFQDVEQVFKRLTAEGGMFYQMQERQAETLAGMMSNLQDRIDLMFNEIGKQNDGVIKGVIKIVQDLLANYDKVANVLEASVAIFGAYKVYVLLTKDALIQYALANKIVTAEGTKQLTVLQLLRVGFAKLATSVKATATAFKTFAASNPWLLALTAIATAIYEVVHWNDEYDEQLDEINKKHNSNAASLNKISEAYNKVAQSAREAAKSQEDFVYSSSDYKELFAQLQKLDEQLKDRGYTLPVNIQLVTPQNIDEVFKGGQELLQMANEFGAEFAKALASETTATEGWFNMFGDNLKTDLEELSDAYGEIGGAFKANLDIIQNEVVAISGELTGAAKEYYDELSKGKKENETETEWTLRRLELLQKINQETKYWGENRQFNSILSNNRLLNELYSQRLDIAGKEKEVQYELNKVLDSLVNKYGSLENLKKAYNDNPMIIKTEIDKQFEAMELSGQAKRFASFWAAQRLQIPIEFTTPKEMPTFFNDFRDTVKTLDTKGIFLKQLESLSTIADLEDMIQKKYKETAEYQEVLNRANTDRLDLEKQILEQKEKLKSSDADERDAAQITINNLERQKTVIDETINKGKEANNEIIAIIKSIASAFNLIYNPPTKKKSKDTTLQTFKEQLSFLEKVNKKYEELQKNYNDEEAKLRVINALKEEAKQKGVESIFMSAEFDDRGTLASMNALEQQYLKIFKKLPAEMQKELAERVGGIELQLDIDVQENRVKEIQNQFSDLFGNYELSLELDNLGLDKNLASQLFGVEVFDLAELRKQLEPFKKELQNTLGKDGVSAWEKMEKQISEMEAKELQERLKTYAQYLKKSISAKAQAEIESQKEIAKIQKTEGLSYEAKTALIKQQREETVKIKAELEWEDFKSSDTYIKMFEDLELVSTTALKRMKDALDGIRETYASSFSPDQLKAFQEQYNKIEEQLVTRNPFSSMRDAMKEINELQSQGRTEDVLQQELLNYDLQAKSLKSQITDLETIIGLKENGISVDTQSEDFLRRNESYLDKTTDILREQVTLKKAALSGVETNIGITNTDLKSYEKARLSLTKMSSEIESIRSLGRSAFDSIVSVLESIGVESDSVGMQLANMGMSMIDLVAQAVLFGVQLQLLTVAATAMGVAINTALGPIGWAVMAIQGIAMALTAIFQIHDKKKEQEIERQLELIEELQKSYEKLEEAIENAYSIDTLKGATKQSQENLKQQNEALKKAMAAEEDKKKTDDDRIKEWQQQYEDNLEKMKELQEQYIEELGGFGSEANIKSAAQEFADAWLEAYMETGDGLDALSEKWDEYIQNVIAKQLMLRGTEKYLQPVMDMLDGMLEDGLFTSSEAQNIQDKIDKIMPQLNEFWKSIAEGFDLDKTEQGDTMSGLSKSIAGITEQQADALAAITESIRFFVSDSNAVQHNIYNWLINPPTESPLMSQLQMQTEHLRVMLNLWNSLATTKPGVSGKVLRVQIF